MRFSASHSTNFEGICLDCCPPHHSSLGLVCRCGGRAQARLLFSAFLVHLPDLASFFSAQARATAAELEASATPVFRQSTAGLMRSMFTRSLFCVAATIWN